MTYGNQDSGVFGKKLEKEIEMLRCALPTEEEFGMLSFCTERAKWTFLTEHEKEAIDRLNNWFYRVDLVYASKHGISNDT